MEHLAQEIEDQVQLIGVALAREQRPLLGPHPMLAGDKREVRQNPEFDGPHLS